jgi:hypothetical protein
MVTAWKSRLHDQVCFRRKRWIGRSAGTCLLQIGLTALPDVFQAQRRHYRLLRRRGSPVLNASYGTAPTSEKPPLHAATASPTANDASAPWASTAGSSPGTPADTPRSSKPSRSTLPPTGKASHSAPTTEFGQFRTEFAGRLPQERALRSTSQPWFRAELRQTAQRIEDSIATAASLEPSDRPTHEASTP